MSLFVSRLLETFVAPLGFGCLALLLALLLSWSRPWLARLLALLALVALGGLGTGAVAQRLIAPLERPFTPPPASVRADAAVVLAGSVDLAQSTPDRVEFYDRPERIIEGVRLVKEGRVRWLVLAGGSGDPLRPEAVEAELLATFARQMGVDPAVIVVQGRSRTTHEDAERTAELLRSRGIGRFFLVTSAFHLPRALGCFRQQGLDPIPYPVDYRARPAAAGLGSYLPGAGGLALSSLAVHEYLGYVVYRVLGYL